MALAVTLTVAGTAYRLMAERASVVIDRNPSQIPVPAGADPILIDLGYFRPKITIEGWVEETAGTDGVVVIPSKENLEDFATDSWNSTISININGDVYTCKFGTVAFEMSATQEDRWTFRVSFVAVGRT